jgi:ATP-dependent Clp protease ATP-binding subunit ClpA
MISGELESALHRAFEYARESGHGTVESELLVLSILETPDVASELKNDGVEVGQLREQLLVHVSNIPRAVSAEAKNHPEPGLDLLRMMQRAILDAQRALRVSVTPSDIVRLFIHKQRLRRGGHDV